ncbi:citrate lyase subunit beta-like protein, mitochondrial-like protein [Euroglyphus maynei]|uniref:Citrate lyase subunit beta-like protein, mitochondrial-like protein n=1 Tax=Euroglyphus maynei TaxID=6958 RepID=A0A1Y3BMQ1_EURMA|nr:citrate lyase subunit beta-like protein, mitochondrial-like protein [Euroglyphus maynei]
MCKSMNNIHFAGIVFGSDDFCANIGATRSDEGKEILMARQHVILVCKSLNLQAIDAVYINFRDLDGLKRQSEEGASMGFTGKQCIHPDQVSIIQEAYRPSDSKIEWAKGLIEEFERAQLEGRGAFVYHDQMIDMPLLKQAYNVMNIAKQIGKA